MGRASHSRKDGQRERLLVAIRRLSQLALASIFSTWMLLAMVVLVVGMVLFPWNLSQPSVYKGWDSNLMYAGSTGGSTIDLSHESAVITSGPQSQATLDYVTSLDDFSVAFDATVRQDNSLASWQQVAVTVVKPAAARYFSVTLGAVNTTMLFGRLAIEPLPSSNRASLGPGFDENFDHPLLTGWKVSADVSRIPKSPVGYGHSLSVGAPSAGEEDAWTKPVGPLPIGARPYTVGAYVERTSGAGPFRIAVNWLDKDYKHIVSAPNWKDWSSYQGTGIPLDARLWYPLEANSIDLQFLSGPTRLITASIFDGQHVRLTTQLGTYELGRTYRVYVLWKSNHSATFRLVSPDGTAKQYLVDQSSGLDLFNDRYVNLSFDSVGAGHTQQAEVSNPSLAVPAGTSFASKASDSRLTAATVVIVVWFLAFVGYRITQAFRNRRPGPPPADIPSRRVSNSKRWRLFAILVPGALVLASVYVALTPIDAYPYDRLAQESYAYVIDTYGLGELYSRTAVAPDAAVRGGHSPWSNIPFAYPPVMAYPFWLIAHIWQLVQGSIAPMHDRAFQIFWKSVLASFVLVDAAILFLMLASAARYSAALVGTALFAFNPALVFDAAIWGETEALLLAALLMSVFGFVRDKPKLGWTALIIGTMIKQTALLAVPVIAAYAVKKYGLRRSLVAGAWGILIGFAVVSPMILAGYSPITVPTADLAQVLSFAHPPPVYASSDTFSIWTLVNGFHGLHGFSRIWAPYPLSFAWMNVSYSSVGTIAFAGIVMAMLVRILLSPPSQLSEDVLYLSVAAVMTSYVAFSTAASGRYLLLALPFAILGLRNGHSIARLGLIVALSAISLVSMYGIYMEAAVRGDWPQYYGLGSPTTNALSGAVYHLYVSDFGITLFGILLLLVTATFLVRVVWRSATDTDSLTPQLALAKHS